jgi:hypothetical protein
MLLKWKLKRTTTEKYSDGNIISLHSYKETVFRDIMSCSSVEVHRRFRGTSYILLLSSGPKNNQPSENKKKKTARRRQEAELARLDLRNRRGGRTFI